jgi:hypothetical protein
MIRRPPMFPPPPTRSFPLMNAFPTQPIAPRPGLGGFLARLFSRGPAMPPTPSGFMMPTLQNAAAGASASTGGGFTGMLTNIQKMLGVAQNVVPMVQQYGPLVKNLPAMMKMWKELKATDDDEKEEKEEKQEEKREKKQSPPAKRDVPTAKSTTQEKQTKDPKPSKPKLYI